MIVDDEALVLCDLAMTVEDLGYEIHSESTNLDDALRALSTDEPDVALLDIDVGGQPVWPLARRVVESGKPVIFISANLHHQELQSEFEKCARLEKPVSASQVEASLKALAA